MKEAKSKIPGARWWIKADCFDVQEGKRESVKHEWSGDIDMGDGKLQAQHASYMQDLNQIATLVVSGIPDILKQLDDEAKEIEEGKSIECLKLTVLF